MKTVVYTTIFGGSDSLKHAPVGVDAVCFVDDLGAYPEKKGWQVCRLAVSGDPRRAAWQMRCRSVELFPTADRTIWIDASHTLTDVRRLLEDAGGAEIAALRHHKRSTIYGEAQELVRAGQATDAEVQRQLAEYGAAGYQSDHLSVSCIIVRSNSERVKRFNVRWNDEIQKHPGDNTQLSIDYAAWREGLTIKALRGSRHENPYASHDAKDHKRRRRPYRSEAAA